MSFLDVKVRTRRAVHAAFAVPCVLTSGGVPFNITARLHNRMAIGGDIHSEGYATIIEGVTRAILNREQLAAVGATPAREDSLTFPNFLGQGQDVVVILDARDPYDGPIDEKWSVGPP